MFVERSQRLFSTIKSEIGFTLLRTFIARSVAAFGSLVLLFVVGKLYGSTGVGVVALAQALMLGAVLLARCGMDSALMRYIGQDASSIHIKLYLRWAVLLGVFLSFIVSGLLLLSRRWLEDRFGSPGLSSILVGVSFSVPAYVVSLLLAGFFKGVRMPATACLMENGLIALLAAIYLMIWDWWGPVAGYKTVGWVYFFSSITVSIFGCFQVRSWFRRNSLFCVGDAVRRKEFLSTSVDFFVSTFAFFFQNVIAVMLAGWLLVPSDLGLFKVSQQIGLLIAFILIVLNAIFPPRFANLFYQGDFQELARLAKQGALVGGVMALPFFVICFIFAEWVLAWFGEGFSNAVPLLRVIALAQLLSVVSGSVAFLLNMTGHQKLMRNIALICNLLGLLAFCILIPCLGPLGAAMALAFTLVAQNFVSLFYVWRVLGIWTLPVPNLLEKLGVATFVGDKR